MSVFRACGKAAHNFASRLTVYFLEGQAFHALFAVLAGFTAWGRYSEVDANFFYFIF